jgi:hypothetical protein
MNAQLAELSPRLLDLIPNLAQPLETIQHEIFSWATQQGLGTIYTRAQFDRLAERARLESDLDEARRQRNMDFRLASGTLTALERRPVEGWEGYLEIWNAQRLTHRMKVFEKTDFSRLRELEIRIGGILLNDRSMPLVLILPQPTGTYLVMGWESVVELGVSPFSPDRHGVKPIREHLLPIEERTMVAPAAS